MNWDSYFAGVLTAVWGAGAIGYVVGVRRVERILRELNQGKQNADVEDAEERSSPYREPVDPSSPDQEEVPPRIWVPDSGCFIGSIPAKFTPDPMGANQAVGLKVLARAGDIPDDLAPKIDSIVYVLENELQGYNKLADGVFQLDAAMIHRPYS